MQRRTRTAPSVLWGLGRLLRRAVIGREVVLRHPGVVREPPLLILFGEAMHDVPHDVYRLPPGHKPPLERHGVVPLYEVSDRLAELVRAHRVHAFLDVDVVADLPVHELRLAQITTNTTPTTAPTTTPRAGATREPKNSTVSRPPKVEASTTTIKATILLALYDTISPSWLPLPRLVYPLDSEHPPPQDALCALLNAFSGRTGLTSTPSGSSATSSEPPGGP